ncbi:unnamed protein product [Closterium sp. Naga37s-1]|nr:unnamed protein product [Closterium sp. Naga37s-1]
MADICDLDQQADATAVVVGTGALQPLEGARTELLIDIVVDFATNRGAPLVTTDLVALSLCVVAKRGAKKGKRGKQQATGATRQHEAVDDEDHLQVKGHERDGERGGERDGNRDSERDGDRDGERYSKRDGDRDGERYSKRDGDRDGERYSKRDGDRDGERYSKRDGDRDGERYSKRDGERCGRVGEGEGDHEGELEVKRDASPPTAAGARQDGAENVPGHGGGGRESRGGELEDQRGVSGRVKSRRRRAGKKAPVKEESSDDDESSEEESGSSSGSEEKYDDEEDES